MGGAQPLLFEHTLFGNVRATQLREEKPKGSSLPRNYLAEGACLTNGVSYRMSLKFRWVRPEGFEPSPFPITNREAFSNGRADLPNFPRSVSAFSKSIKSTI